MGHTLRRAYDLIALLALLNVGALLALGAWLWTSGAMTPQKLGDIGAILRGDAAPTTSTVPGALGPQTAQAEDSTAPPADAPPATFAELQMNMEVARLEAERIKTELDQRLALNNSILLRVTTEREAFQKDRQRAEERDKQSAALRDDEGFAKQLEIFENLAPKVAVEHLLNLGDPDEAARLLLEMDARKAKKIVESAKRGTQAEKMRDIMQRLRAVAPAKSEELVSPTP